MNETDFFAEAQALFSRVEDELERLDLDVDSDRYGNVLTLEGESGGQIVLNLHAPTQQIWLASRSAGLHFERRDGRWVGTRDGIDFWDALSQSLERLTGRAVRIGGQKI